MKKSKCIIIVFIYVLLSHTKAFPQSDFQINSEIASIFHGINNEDILKEVAEIYKDHRLVFLKERGKLILEEESKVDSIIRNSNIKSKHHNMIIDYWNNEVEKFRVQTIQRDSNRIEGLECLKKVYKNELVNYRKSKNELSIKIQKILSKDEVIRIQKISSKYLFQISNIQDNFRETEEIYYGQIGTNITIYNQISFDLIKKVISSQYGKIINQTDKRKIVDIYNSKPKLFDLFEEYSKAEYEIVNAISKEECFKRIGILRFYDGLNQEQIKNVQILNMMLNLTNN